MCMHDVCMYEYICVCVCFGFNCFIFKLLTINLKGILVNFSFVTFYLSYSIIRHKHIITFLILINVNRCDSFTNLVYNLTFIL